MEPNWLDSYYEALEFFYWEPQHMRRKLRVSPEHEQEYKEAKRVKSLSKFSLVQTHLREMEVTLNQNIKQFFYLAPDDLRNNLFKEVFGRPFEGSFALCGREIDSAFKLENVMQPDFLFVSEQAVVSMEMKIKAKCSIEQVLKYAFLGLKVETIRSPEKEHYLIILGQGKLSNQFKAKDHFDTKERLKEQMKKNCQAFVDKREKKDRRFLEENGNAQRFVKIIDDMRIHFWNYQDFSEFLEHEKPPESANSLGGQVCRKLIDGLIEEFRCRKLIPQTAVAVGA